MNLVDAVLEGAGAVLVLGERPAVLVDVDLQIIGQGQSTPAEKDNVGVTLLTRAASPASCVPMKFVASTLAYSHLRWGKVRLKFTFRRQSEKVQGLNLHSYWSMKNTWSVSSALDSK